jgi:hypothetical protein
MKKLLLTAAILAASAGAANAEINVGIGINQPAYPVYVAPAPTVVYYNEQHRNYDWNYWRPAERRVIVEQRTYIDHDDHGHGHGHGKAKGHYKNRH